MDEKQKELEDKLSELKRYRNEQMEIIQIQQKNQKAVLTKEQLQMYEILGISLSSYMELSSSANIPEKNVLDLTEDEELELQLSHDDMPDVSSESDGEENVSKIVDYNNELVNKNTELPEQKQITDDQRSEERQVEKRPFLKRGVGLTNRFRVPPDAFSLKKLPKYKYADRVKRTLAKQKNVTIPDPEAQKEQKKVDKNVREKKVTVKVPEKRKSVNEESSDLVVPQNLNLKAPETLPESNPPPLETLGKSLIPVDIHETPKVQKYPKGVSWAQVLSSNNIIDSSFNLDYILGTTKEDHDSTGIFQLLEQKIGLLNLESSPSTVIRLLASMQCDRMNGNGEEDRTIVNPEDPLIDDANSVNVKLQPHPKDINKKIIIDDDMSSSEDENNETSSDHRVRFSDEIEIVTRDDGDSTILSSDLDAVELSQTSTPNERLRFNEFKKQMLGKNTVMQVQHDDLKEKSEMLIKRLQEIEKEKANLIKIRNELDLDRIQFEHEKDDLMEKLKDERIKMEIELHDERLKIEQQKQKMEKMMRDAKTPSKKEREEISKLKETIDDLKEEIKTKETRHAATSARYRSQIKQLEKENQSLKLELDVVKKDNKKLELENARAKRDSSSKMLQEINKNIAKLTNVEASANAKKIEPARRKSDTAIKKKAPVHKSSAENSSPSENEEEDGRKINPLRTRMSDPVTTSQQPTTSDIISDMKREIVNADGSKDIWYPNGNLKKISADGMMIRMLYYNKDIKETNINEGTIKYYYADTNTWHTTYIDGLEILEYPDGQIEHRYKDGTVEVHHTDGSIRISNKNWTNDVREEWRLQDGTNATIYKNDTKIYSFPNGQREIHTLNHKRREYPDGTVKIMYEDGTMETRYSNGRIRVKDKDGNLISDNMAK